MFETFRNYFYPKNKNSKTEVYYIGEFTEEYMKKLCYCNDFDENHLKKIQILTKSEFYMGPNKYGSTYFDHYAYGQLDDLSSLKLRTDSLREFSLFSFKSNLKKVRGRLEYLQI